MSQTIEQRNKALVLKAFDTLFNLRDNKAAERFWSVNYIQHSAHIPPGREGLFGLIRSVPATLRYEPDVILADRDFVIVHGRFSGIGRGRSWIAADIVRIADGVLVEHWGVLQDEAAREESQCGIPAFCDEFPSTDETSGHGRSEAVNDMGRPKSKTMEDEILDRLDVLERRATAHQT